MKPMPLFQLLDSNSLVDETFEFFDDDAVESSRWVPITDPGIASSLLQLCTGGEVGGMVKYSYEGDGWTHEYEATLLADDSPVRSMMDNQDVIHVLKQKCLETTRVRTVRGVRSDAVYNVAKELVKAYPEGLKETNEDGDTPYDFAVKKEMSEKMLELLKHTPTLELTASTWQESFDSDAEDLPPLAPTPTHRAFSEWGGVVTTKISGAQVFVPSKISPGSITVTEVAREHIEGSLSRSVLEKVAGPVLTFDGDVSSQMKVRLPHNGGRDIKAWMQTQDGEWNEVKSRQIESITDSYATVNFESLPKSATVTSTSWDQAEVECSVQLWTGLKRYSVVVMENMVSSRMQVADAMMSKNMKMVDEGSVFGGDLQLKLNDFVTVTTENGEVSALKV